MFFMYVILSTAVLLVASVIVAVYQQKQIKVSVVAREEVNEKDFFALRVESEDFLFVKDEMEDVSFIQSLDDVDEFSIKNLAEEAERKISKHTKNKISKGADKKPQFETAKPPLRDNVISLRGESHSSDKLVMPKNEKKVS